jgi:sugar lactone lactonase YvrE
VLLTAATCVVGATAAGQAGPTFKPAGKWGRIGTANGQFRANAYGLATDKAGNVYVADTDNFRIQVFSATGAFRRSHAFGPDVSVQDVATAADGSVWGTALQAGEARSFGGGGNTISVSSGGGARGIAVDANGNVYVASSINNVHQVTRFDKAGGLAKGKTFGGFTDPGDVETSPDGSFYVVDGLTVKRFVDDRVAKVIRGGVSKPIGIGVDLDCNLWMTNISQRNLTKVSPSGNVLGTAATPDLIAQDVAVGPKGDLYAYDSGTHSVVRLAEDRAKPATATVGRRVAVANGVAKVKYTLSGVACPAQVPATASLSGAVNGKASVRVAAGKSTVLSIPARGSSGKAQFKIVLKTNGRPTTQVASVDVAAR